MLERWTLLANPIPRESSHAGGPPCDECAPLGGTVWPAGQGPQPPLHPNCRCWRIPIETVGMTPAELIRMGIEAATNAGRYGGRTVVRGRGANGG